MPDGTKLVTVHNPIKGASKLHPGEFIVEEGTVKLNEGTESIELTVSNTGDRPIQASPYLHIFEETRLWSLTARLSGRFKRLGRFVLRCLHVRYL